MGVEILEIYNKAFVFNLSKKDLWKHMIIANRIDAGESGESRQIVEFYLDDGSLTRVDKYINPEVYFTSVTETGGGYYDFHKIVDALENEGVKVEGILVVTRTMSDYIADKKDNSYTAERYNFCSEEVSEILKKNPALVGLLAEKRRAVNNVEDMVNLLCRLRDEGDLSDFSYNRYMYMVDGRRREY